jgi:predicted site-specific integrase-resolvase
MPPQGYTLKQVANSVGTSTATIVRWIDTRKVTIVKRKNAQGRYVFSETDLRKLKEHAEKIDVYEPRVAGRPPRK